MEDKIFDIVTDLIKDNISKDEAIDKLLILYNVSGSLLKSEQWRIWKELCKGECDGAFSSTIELEADDVHDMIFKGKEIKV